MVGDIEREAKKVPLHHSKWTQGGDDVDIQALQNLEQRKPVKYLSRMLYVCSNVEPIPDNGPTNNSVSSTG